MTLADRAKAKQSRQGPACGIAVLFASVDDTYRAEVQDMLAAHGLQATSIAAVLKEDGHTIGADSIRRHRKRQCRCDG